jgi:hypothetical protein
MTTELHGELDLSLNEKSLKSLDKLIGNSRKICFSGEGETLMAWKSILKLLNRPGSGRTFEIITSAFWPYDRLNKFLNDVREIISANGDTCNVRVSVDEFHSAKVKHNNISKLISRFLEAGIDPHLTLGFRSITGQEEFVRGVLEAATSGLGAKAVWNSIDPLRHFLTVNSHEFQIDYKNIVSPGPSGLVDPFPLGRYIAELERRYGRPFTLGSLEYSDNNPGFDITVNPNGDVVFYGMENKPIGNVANGLFDYGVVASVFASDPLYQLLYKTPFNEILRDLRRDEEMSTLIDSVNNPYWIVRNAEGKFPGRFESLLSSRLV